MCDESKKQFGVDVYDYCQKAGALPIRERFTESYVARGTYHELSNSLEIGWHPDYELLIITASDQGAA